MNSGFTVGSGNEVNGSGNQYASWTWRKQKGFFDIVTYTGDGSSSGRQIAHSLGSVPGCIMVKCTSATNNWAVYHRGTDPSIPENYGLNLNNTNARVDNEYYWNDTKPTSTHFTIRDNANVNDNGQTYVAYVFAGGPSTAATARSVDFDGSDDQLNIPDSTDWDLGNGDFTLETWIKSTQTTSGYFTALGQWTTHTSPDYGWAIRYASQDIGTGWSFFYSTTGSNYITTMGSDISDGQWHHVAVCRSGNNLRTFTDGILNTTRSTTDTFNTSGTTMKIGGQDTSGNYFDGKLSNVRLVKGTALYTGRFRPPLAPLTNVTNTKLLCCNNSSVTGSSVTPGTITASSSPTASTDSPFDDPAGFKFGEEGDQNIIKCGSYVGNSTANHEMEIGWEPQWWLVKNITSGNSNWQLLDSMRGWVIEANDQYFAPNNVSAESAFNFGNPTSTGFNMSNASSNWQNADGNTYIYIAIRRPDGYVGKPPDAGTDVLSIATGWPNSASAGEANFTSGFVTDYLFWKQYQSSSSWYTASRLVGKRYLVQNDNNTQATNSNYEFSYNDGFYVGPYTITDQMAWSFKRHAGFDVVTYKGDGVAGRQIPHSLNKIPEMMWVKSRDSSGNDAGWQVYHKGLGRTDNDPQGWNLQLNTGQAENWNNTGRWNFTVPASTHFTLGNYDGVNKNGDNMIAVLFASVEGISKVGYYDGQNTELTITTGFQPRFLIVKKTNATSNWFVADSTRGWGPNPDQILQLNTADAQFANNDFGAPTATGFTLNGAETGWNEINHKYIYYAHA